MRPAALFLVCLLAVIAVVFVLVIHRSSEEQQPAIALRYPQVKAWVEPIDGQPDPSEAYALFFNRVRGLMTGEDMDRNGCVERYGPSFPDCRRLQPDADNWLTEQFNPHDIERIKYETSQWYIGGPHDIGPRAFAQPGINSLSQQRSLDVGEKLESELVNGRRFHIMIENCARRLRLAPELHGCSFAPVKLRAA